MIDTTKMLLTFLSASLEDLSDNGDQISFTSMHPKDIHGTSTARVNLYLYQLVEDSFLENTDLRKKPETNLLPGLSYHYMITIHGMEDESGDFVLLEKIRELIFKNPHIESDNREIVLNVAIHNQTLESITSLWQALQAPLRPGLNCIVRERSR